MNKVSNTNEMNKVSNTNEMNKVSKTKKVNEMNKISKLNTIIITNDHYNNYADIIKEIKEYNLRTYKGNTIFNTEMSNKNVIEYTNKKLLDYKEKLNKTGFYVSPKNYYNKKRKLN
jgi:replicative DNA helicase